MWQTINSILMWGTTTIITMTKFHNVTNNQHYHNVRSNKENHNVIKKRFLCNVMNNTHYHNVMNNVTMLQIIDIVENWSISIIISMCQIIYGILYSHMHCIMGLPSLIYINIVVIENYVQTWSTLVNMEDMDISQLHNSQ